MIRRLLVAASVLASVSAPAADVVLTSPGGQVTLRIAQDGSSFSVARRGEPVIADSALGLEFDDAPALGPLVLAAREDAAVDNTVTLVATKAAVAVDRYRGTTLHFRETDAAGRELLVDARAYDDGVAFRYRIEGTAPVRLRGERTTFVPSGDPACFASVVGASHEKHFDASRLSALGEDVAYDVPLACATPSGRTHYAITQAGLGSYTGASLWRVGKGVQVRLSRVPGRDGPAYVSPGGLATAWRVVMMADRAGDLIGSHLIGNLNPPPDGDFSWVRPGKVAWDWWSGPLAGAVPDMGRYRRFIDFAAQARLPYVLLDAGWAHGSGPCCEARPETDITRAADGIDMPELVRYAAARGVGILLWAHWQHASARLDEVLDTWVGWGIQGIKCDFMDRDDQDMVAFYQRIAAATARRHLLLDLHGAYPPAGLERTYPNFITQEGVLGAEWNKMTRDVTPRHNVTLPYTRMLLGPMDYTPGGFRNGTPATFEVRDLMPMTQTTRGQALGMYVVYDSPLQMVSDDPDAYSGQEGFEFIRRVPTAWDETRFLAGEPARDVVVARRLGKAWYVGAMTGDEPAVECVRLAFLPPGRYRATIWQDGATPAQVRRSERLVGARDVLELRLAAAGGAAVILEPLSNRDAAARPPGTSAKAAAPNR